MPPLLDAVPTRYLPLDDYIADYNTISGSLDGDIWKSERAQSFREPGNPSWEAFVAGRWDDAVASAAESLPELIDYFAGLAGQGSRFYRVRAVEFPLTAYLHWELYVLRVRAQAGERIRIALPRVTASAESLHGTIPELVILGHAAGYVVDYGADGTPRGAEKFVDADAILRCRAVLQKIYDESADFEQFFVSEVEPLGEPIRDPGSQ